MIQPELFVHKTRLLIAAATPFVAAGLLLLVPAQGWAGAKGRQAKLQKVVDARAVQMQADGTVGTDCNTIARRGETKEIASKEARAMLLTGGYSTSVCTVYGSKPELFYKGLNGLIYYRYVTRESAKIEVYDVGRYGSEFIATGPMRNNTNSDGSTYTTQPGFSSKKLVSAKAYFIGTRTAVIVLTPEVRKDYRALCEDNYSSYMKSKNNSTGFAVLNDICFPYYPSLIDENMETLRRYAESRLVDR
jgi:hypothetical protein